MTGSESNMIKKEEYDWELRVQDNFDWDAPRRIDSVGRGLETGLKLLWQRHLTEGILEDGRSGFLAFNLRVPVLDSTVILRVDREIGLKLRQWSAENEDFLSEIAAYHYRLLERGEPVDLLFDIVGESVDNGDCIERFHHC